jgi:hypothetical protein
VKSNSTEKLNLFLLHVILCYLMETITWLKQPKLEKDKCHCGELDGVNISKFFKKIPDLDKKILTKYKIVAQVNLLCETRIQTSSVLRRRQVKVICSNWSLYIYIHLYV